MTEVSPDWDELKSTFKGLSKKWEGNQLTKYVVNTKRHSSLNNNLRLILSKTLLKSV